MYKRQLYQSLGRWSDAAASLQKAIEIGMQQANPPYNYLALGRLYAQSGNFALAKEYLEQIDITREDSLYYPGKYWHTVWLLDFANLYVAWEMCIRDRYYTQKSHPSFGPNCQSQSRLLNGTNFFLCFKS